MMWALTVGALGLAAPSSPVLAEEEMFGGHTDSECVAAASYQLSECQDLVLRNPNVAFGWGNCWNTFYYLRDDPDGCHQFD
jgi:hypothetical protein